MLCDAVGEEAAWDVAFNFEDSEERRDFFTGLWSLALEGDFALPNSREEDLDLFVGVVGVWDAEVDAEAG